MPQETAHEAPQMRFRPALILAGTAAPLALAGFHFFAYAATPWICLRQALPLLWVGSAAAIVLASSGLAAGLAISIRRVEEREDAPGPAPRGAFMGSVSALFSALILLVLIGQAAATLLIDACHK